MPGDRIAPGAGARRVVLSMETAHEHADLRLPVRVGAPVQRLRVARPSTGFGDRELEDNSDRAVFRNLPSGDAASAKMCWMMKSLLTGLWEAPSGTPAGRPITDYDS